MNPKYQSVHVALNRHFKEISKGENERIDPEYLSSYSDWLLELPLTKSWESLCERKRVVILAPAGSGKSHEMSERHKFLTSENHHSFYIPIEDLDNGSFEDALSIEEESKFAKWKSANGEPAWFFLDSVDELKLVRGSLRRALRKFSKSIDGKLHDAHILISCRPTDWDKDTDERVFRELFPTPIFTEKTEMTAEELFLTTIHGQSMNDLAAACKTKEPDDKKILTVILLPLSNNQIKEFAIKKGVEAPDTFVEEIEKTNAWVFARRPLDLLGIIPNWNESKSIGTRQEQHRLNVESKLEEVDGRPDSGVLSLEEANGGVKKLALAITLTKTRTIKSTGRLDNSQPNEAVLDCKKLLNNWTDEKRETLLRRGLFDPETLGRVAFHSRSVEEFLAACRLYELREKKLSIQNLFRLLFADKYGEKVVLPSMAPVAAWLALWDSHVFKETLSREPEILIEHGDPASFSSEQQQQIIKKYVEMYKCGSWRGHRFQLEQIERLASPMHSELVKECWGNEPTNPEVKELLLHLVWKGKLSNCAGFTLAVACNKEEQRHIREIAIRALVACGSISALKRIVTGMLDEPEEWPKNLVANTLPALFPSHCSFENLLQLLKRHEDREEDQSPDRLMFSLRDIVSNDSINFDRPLLRQKLTEMFLEETEPVSNRGRLRFKYRSLALSLVILCNEELHMTNTPMEDLLISCALSFRMCSNRDVEKEQLKNLRDHFETNSDLRERLFWLDIGMMDKLVQVKDTWDRYCHIRIDSILAPISNTDVAWLENTIKGKATQSNKEIALHAILDKWYHNEESPEDLVHLKSLAKKNKRLSYIINKKIETKSNDLKMDQGYSRDQVDQDRRQEEIDDSWLQWRKKVIDNPNNHFTTEKHKQTIKDTYDRLERVDKRNSRYCVWNYEFLANAFSKPFADAAKSAFMKFWRTEHPALPSERKPEHQNSTPYVWIYGLCGVAAETETPGWASKLTKEEAKLAIRYATVEINGFASFINDLVEAWPEEVAEVLGIEIDSELSEIENESSKLAIQYLSHSDLKLRKLLKPKLVQYLANKKRKKLNPPWHQLDTIFQILRKIVTLDEAQQIGESCLKEVQKNSKGKLSQLWLKGVFLFTPDLAVNAFEKHFAFELDTDGKSLGLAALANLFGHRGDVGFPIPKEEKQVKALGNLLRMSYKIVKPEDDAEHEGAYTPDTRDEAESARSQLLSTLIATPGYAAQQELLNLSQEQEFQHIPERLKLLARERASKDADSQVWSVEDVFALEERFEKPPKGRDELFQTVLDRLDDIQHDISHHDFSDRVSIQRITIEKEIQPIIASKLEVASGNSYNLDREPEVVDGKKPDIRISAVTDETKVSIELKIADNWSYQELENALHSQLTEKYLRHKHCQAGFLLMSYHGKKVTIQVPSPMPSRSH